MTGGDNGGIAENGLADDDADIYAHLTDAAVSNPHFLDEAMVLVHQQYPKLLYVQVLHQGVHVVVYPGGRSQFWTLLDFLHLSPLAQLTGRHNGDGLRWSHTIILAQIVDAHLAKRVQVIVTIFQNAFHQTDGILLGRARPNQDGQQLGIAQRLRSQSLHLFAGTVFLCPLVNVELRVQGVVFFHLYSFQYLATKLRKVESRTKDFNLFYAETM